MEKNENLGVQECTSSGVQTNEQVNLNENVDAAVAETVSDDNGQMTMENGQLSAEESYESAVAEGDDVQRDVDIVLKSDKGTLAQKRALLEVYLRIHGKRLTNDEKVYVENAIEELKFDQSEAFADAFLKLRVEYCEVGGYLDEIHVLRRVVKLVSDRITEISDDALQEGMDVLSEENRTNGAFEFNGNKFEISERPVYDFVNHAQRYTMEEGVRYREFQSDRESLSKMLKANTREMATITKNFPLRHPDWTPDWTEYVLKCK